MAEQTASSYLIIGNGIAGATAAEVLRAEDSAATITVIADDPFPVYYRPALKDYLAGRVPEDKLWARSASFYQDHTIRFLPDRVVGIQAAQHSVQLQSGRQVGYNRLLLANGARPASLRCPGQNLVGVYTLRSVADYQALLENLSTTRRVVVSGSGTLALETIETLRHRGYAVTHLVRRRTLWSEILDATASDLVLQQERRDGVEVLLGEEIVEISGRRGEVSGVVTSSGAQIACETVIIAVGVEPNIDFIKASGIACGRGVRVDSRMRTNTLDIFAAGDVLETQDMLTGRVRLIGQWYPSIQQGRAAAYSMLDLLDTNRPFNSGTFYNATFLYGLDFASVGFTINVPGLQEIVAEPKPRTYRKVLLKDGVPVGMLALGDRRQALAFKRAIDHRVNLQAIASMLLADSFNLNEWLDRQGVPPPLLGVARQGDATIKQVAYAGAQPSPAAMASRPQLTEALLIAADRTEGVPAETRLSTTQVITVGRQQGVQLLIDEATVSRRHAEISYTNGQFILHDLGSSNGTFVNNARLQPASAYVLKPDDIVRFGKVVNLKFVARAISGQAKNMRGVSMAGIPDLQDAPGERADPRGQPLLRPDGSLLLPGATTPLPAAVVASFKQAAALVVLQVGNMGESKHPPEVFLLKEGKRLVVGRDQGMDIELADPVVSRRHAEISTGPDGFYIRDLESSNGVTVNQACIDNPYRLSHGDRIALGGCMLYFVDLRASPERQRTEPVREQPPRAEPVSVTAKQPASGREVGEHTARQERVPVASVASGRQDGSASLPQLVVCSKCGGVNTRSARFCASCSAPLSPRQG
ncbi:MAG: FAD-dependent oxidoreductase [Chloroflexota bacterium]|nr:FAD-dependent oxidoreductase [Chloroflexota bacterium]